MALQRESRFDPMINSAGLLITTSRIRIIHYHRCQSYQTDKHTHIQTNMQYNLCRQMVREPTQTCAF